MQLKVTQQKLSLNMLFQHFSTPSLLINEYFGGSIAKTFLSSRQMTLLTSKFIKWYCPFCNLCCLIYQYIIRMARNQGVVSTVQNIFALNRVRKECYFEPIRVDFSPIEKPHNPVESITPFFNNDRNYFTQSFILKKQKISLQQNLQTQKNKFEARISHSEKPDQDDTPQYKPTDSKYCQLCQEYFNDYWEHINDKYHKRMINSSKFNKDITALCQSFEVKDRKKTTTKTKRIQKTGGGKKPQRLKDSKTEGKTTIQSHKKMTIQQLKIQMNEGKRTEVEEDLQKMEMKNPEESLKIMLQLGNYSTNLLSSNALKQLCREP